jgi:hypothetical protein
MPEQARYVRPAMARVLGRLRLLALLLPACVPAVSPDDLERGREAAGATSPASPVATVSAPAAEGLFELALDGAAPQPATEALLRAPGRELAPTHAERTAWSADGQTFAHCRRLPALDCTECRFLHRDGTTELLESGPACGEGAIARATLDARLASVASAAPATRWRAGAEVVLVVETREAETTNAGLPRPMLKLGARSREGGPPAWLLHVDPCEGCGIDQACAAQAHFDVIAPSPDGTELAVLIHELAPDGTQSLRVERLTAERVARATRARASTPTP